MADRLSDPKFATMPVMSSAQLAAAAAAHAANPGPATATPASHPHHTLPAAHSSSIGTLTQSPSVPSLISQASMSNLEQKENQYPVTSDGYDVYDEIGVGAFATVYRAVVKETGEEVAIKVLDLDQFNTNWDEIRREILVMSLLHHPNVVAIKCSFVDQQDLWIVMPLLQAGSCASIMKQLFVNGFKDEALIATILRETLQGLLYFHKDSRIHRDVKAGNILVSDKGEVQLADFGVAGTLMENGDRKKNRSTFTGTPCWMAPEVMEHTTGYDEKADIWSFGITAMELGYGRAPYAKFQPMKVMLLTLQEEPPTCDIYNDNSYKFSKHYHSLIAKCLRKDPKKRPNARKLLEHKFFKQARDAAYIRAAIVSKLPPRQRGPKQILSKEKLAVDRASQQKSKPVSVGSWVFDENDIASVKARAAATAAARRSVDSTADDESHSSDDDTSPRAAPATQVKAPPETAAAVTSPTEDVVITEQAEGIHFGHTSSMSSNSSPSIHDDATAAPASTPAPIKTHSRMPSQEQRQGRFFVSEGDADDTTTTTTTTRLPTIPSPTQTSTSNAAPTPTATTSKIGRFAVTEDA